MRRIILILLILNFLLIPARASEITAPSAPSSVGDLMPYETESFAQGLYRIFADAMEMLQPDIAKCFGICLSLVAASVILSVVKGFRGQHGLAVKLIGTIVIAVIVLEPTNVLIKDSALTVEELSNYGKLLLPVMATAMAAQGGVTASATIYATTAFADALLSSLVANVMVPMVYIYLILCIVNAAVGEELIKKLRDMVRWLIAWCLRTILYVFTGYLSITGVVSGAADQLAVKATKLTISGMVPVVGGIISDASESILVSVGLMKSAAGTYGLLALIAIAIGPFLNIGIQHLLLKGSAVLCGLFADKESSELIGDFSSGMGLMLAMTGTVCLVQMFSTVCFMKGMG